MRHRRLQRILVGIFTFCVLLPAARASEGLASLDASLKLVPADAAFYNTMLRNREQLETLLHSRAWAKLMGLPALRTFFQMAQAQLQQPGSPLAGMQRFFEQAENRQLIELLADMGSDEIFFYGGQSCIDFTDLLSRLLGSMQFGPAMMQMNGTVPGADISKLQLRAVLKSLSENQKLLKAPDLVIGFRINKAEAAKVQLKRLELLLTELVKQVPLLKGRLKRVPAPGGEFLALSLDGSMVPWDRLPIKDAAENEGEFDDLLDKLKELKLTIGLGVRDRYVLFTIGTSLAHLDKLGGKNSLEERTELRPLSSFTDRRLTSISYVSKAFQERLSTGKRNIESYVAMAEQFLAKSNLPDDAKTRIGKDLKALGGDLKGLFPDVGATVGVSFLNGRGYESYSYDYGDHRADQASKPLTLLHHVGGKPILALVSRTAYSVENYRMLVKWIKVFNKYFEELVLPNLDADTAERYEKLAEGIHPLLRRLDETTRKALLPALADGQFAFVLDARIKSRQWYQQLPRSEKPLPMLEPALVLGVSDEALLLKAFADYRTILNDVIAEVHKQVPAVPEFQLPPPAAKKVKSGTIYYYALPLAVFGIDPQIAPAAGVSKHALVLAISHSHVERLLTRTPLPDTSGPPAHASRPLTGAVYFDWSALVDAAAPWIDYGIRQMNASKDKEDESDKPAADPKLQSILQQVETAFEILKCFRTYTSASYLESGVLITHGETVFSDLRD